MLEDWSMANTTAESFITGVGEGVPSGLPGDGTSGLGDTVSGLGDTVKVSASDGVANGLQATTVKTRRAVHKNLILFQSFTCPTVILPSLE